MIRKTPAIFFAISVLVALTGIVSAQPKSTTALPAQNSPTQPEFTAKRLSTDRSTGDIIGTGDARLTFGLALLTADEIRYNPTTETASARGNVQFTRSIQRLVADELTYHLRDGTFSLTAPRFGEYPYYISGEKASGTFDKLTLTNATASYQEPGPFAPTLRANTLTYTSSPKPSISTENTRIGVGSFGLVSLPKFSQKINQPLLSYVDAKAGYRGNLGAFLDLGLHVPVYEGIQAGGGLAYFTKRGVLFGPGGTYDITTENGNRITGSLDTGYIHDTGDRLTDILQQPIPPDRGYVQWRHSQTITPELKLFGQANYWSDSEIMRDFRPSQYYPVQQPDNFLEADYTGSNYIVSLFARAQFNPYYPVQQRLPELRFDLLPMDIGTQGILQKGQFSAASLADNSPDPFGPPTIDSNRLDAYYALSRPIAFKDIATITPVVGGRLTYYSDATGGKDDYSRFLGEIGFDAALRASGVFNYKNEKWGIDGLRHIITPRLSYRYIPQADKGTPYIPAIDDQTFSTYLQPLGLGEIRNIDQISPTNTVRIGLDNTLQTRNKGYGSRDLVILNLAADLRLDDTTPVGERDFSAIHVAAALMPIEWLRFNLYQSFTPQDFTLREINTGFSIHDGQLWSAGLSTHYLKDQINEYIGEGRYRLNEKYQVYLRLHYDARENRFNERSFGVVQKLGHNLWTIRYGVTLYQGHTRESDFGFSLEVRLAGF